MKEYINQVLGNSLRCILPSYWWKRLLGMMADRIERAETNAANYASRLAVYVDNSLADKQDKLVSGQNIRTIYGQNILGSGDIIFNFHADDELSEESVNAVQNQAVTKKLKELEERIAALEQELANR